MSKDGRLNVAAVVCGMDEEYPYQIIMGINHFVREHDVNISYFAAFGGIIDSKNFDAGEYSIYNLPDFKQFDGALLLTNTFSDAKVRNSITDRVKEAGIPAVIFECRDHKEFYDVSIDNYSVMKKLVEHLITKHGARVLHFVAGPAENPEATARYRAFRDALSENGILFDEKERYFQGCFRSYDGVKAIEAFVESGLSLPDAFVCANDNMALTLMSRLQQMGYRVPEDVIVTGFDCMSNARNACPALTTVKRPVYYSGEKACEILMALIRGEEQPRSTDLEASPVFSESCGCREDDLEDMEDFRRNTYLRFERTYSNVHMLNRLLAGLAEAEKMEECILAIEQMLKIIDCEQFSLCLVSNWENSYNVASFETSADSYSPTLTAPLVWDHGERRSVKSFPRERLFPEPLTTGGNVSYFLPLHFNQRCLGYYVMTNCDFPIQSLLCHTTTMSIGNAIDGISKVNVFDPLCKMYNRNGFNRNAEYVFRECVAEQSPLTVIFVDLDGLKKINDTYGHQEGDFAIKSIAERISSSCGSMDVCGRYGGDEFVVVGRTRDLAETFAQKLEQKLKELNDSCQKPYEFSASVGAVTATPKKDGSLFDLIQQADVKMYEVKRQKKAGRT